MSGTCYQQTFRGDACDDDTDDDGVPTVVDVCDFTPEGMAIDDTGRPRGDLDEDCDVDLEDFALFSMYMGGPIP